MLSCLLFIFFARQYHPSTFPYKERGLSCGRPRLSIFFQLLAYSGLRFHCTTPPESSVRQCFPAHSLTSTLWQAHVVVCLYILLYAEPLMMSIRKWPRGGVWNQPSTAPRPFFFSARMCRTRRPTGAEKPRRKACSTGRQSGPVRGLGRPQPAFRNVQKDIPKHCWPTPPAEQA